MLKIRLQRTGRTNSPTYRLVVAEHSRPVKGKHLEVLGYYLPTRTPNVFEYDAEKILAWIKKGACPTDTVARLLDKAGVKGMDKFIVRYAKKRSKSATEEVAA
jgi:small subunit ribosomal protein S16